MVYAQCPSLDIESVCDFAPDFDFVDEVNFAFVFVFVFGMVKNVC